MSTSAILPDFVIRHLNTIAQRERFLRYEYKCEAGAKPGDGIVATVLSIELSGTRSEDGANGTVERPHKLALMCKLLPENVHRQRVFRARTLFEREVYFYDHLQPFLERFQLDKGLTAQTGFFSTVQCFVAIADAKTNEYVIIMQDLRQLGYEMWDKKTPMPSEKAALLFEQLGRLHGVSLVLGDQHPDQFAAFAKLDDNMTRMLTSIESMCNTSFRQAVDIITSPDQNRVLRDIRDNWKDILNECVQGRDRFTVLAHGDSWNNNMMFAGQHSICLLDWQICRLSSPAIDLAFFICSSTDRTLRERHLDDLLHIYHRNLSAVCRTCGSDADTLFPFHELQNQLRKFARYGVVMAPLLMQSIVSDASTIVDLDALATEMSKPVIDTSKIEFMRFDAVSLANYRQRLGDVIEDAKSYGWI